MRRISPQARLLFLGHLSHMLSAGIPLARALDSLREQAEPTLGEAVAHLSLRVRQGRPLSDAMEAVPGAFSALHVAVVRVAESSGELPRTLHRLTRHEERDLAIVRQVRATLVYPTTVFACAVLFIAALARSLLGGMAPLLQHAGVPLPLPTRALLGAVLLSEKPLLAVLAIPLGIGLLHLARHAAVLSMARAAMWRVPVLGSALRELESVRLCESLAIMLGSGMPMLQTLQRLADTCSRAETRAAVVAASRQVMAGERLSRALAQRGLIGGAAVHMMAVGEESGRLPTLLERLVAVQEAQVRSLLESLAASAEPVMICAMGVLVGAIILAVFAPLYGFIGNL